MCFFFNSSSLLLLQLVLLGLLASYYEQKQRNRQSISKTLIDELRDCQSCCQPCSKISLTLKFLLYTVDVTQKPNEKYIMTRTRTFPFSTRTLSYYVNTVNDRLSALGLIQKLISLVGACLDWMLNST